MRASLIGEIEAARLLGVRVSTLRKWRIEGRGPRFVHVGRAVRYDPAELDDYIQRQTRQSTREAVQP